MGDCTRREGAQGGRRQFSKGDKLVQETANTYGAMATPCTQLKQKVPLSLDDFSTAENRRDSVTFCTIPNMLSALSIRRAY